jgi:hypothetical protein
MRSLEGRLHKLETQLQARQPCWSPDVKSARTRAAARVRLKIGEMRDAAWHPAVQSAREILSGDTLAQAAADLDTLRHWSASHPEAFDPDEDGCTRIMQKLEEMAQRPDRDGNAMNAIEQIAVDEELFMAQMVLQIVGLKLQVAAMQREIDELKAKLARLEPHA